MPITINTLVDYSHRPLTHIAVQVLYTVIQSDLSPHKHHYLIYYPRTFLRILKFGYLALNIMINSSPSSHALIICVTPFSAQYLTIYGHPIKNLESSVGTMKNTKNGYIDVFSLHTICWFVLDNSRNCIISGVNQVMCVDLFV